ncbi:MAG: RICIN domain-containing protein [Clostridia bacterium]|nr:RICIN domain-containing protein [Clostridia bacterium]
MKNKGFISLTACMLAFLMLSFPVIALGMDESASSAFVPDTSGGYYEEFTDPTPSDDDVIGGVIGGGQIELQDYTVITSSVVPDGVYALMNVGNNGLYMGVQQNILEPGAYVQQYAFGFSPADNFTRAGLFKIAQVGTTGRYTIRFMLNNLVTIYFDGSSVKTKTIHYDDTQVDPSDTFTITYSTSGYTITPYGQSYCIASRNTTASGAAGAPSSYLIKSTLSSSGNQARWQLQKYISSDKSGVTVSASKGASSVNFASNGITKEDTYTLSLYPWSTRINVNNATAEIPTAFEGCVSLEQIAFASEATNIKYSLTAIKSGQFRLYYYLKTATDSNNGIYYGIYYVTPPFEMGTYYIRNGATNLHVDIEGPSVSEGAAIQQWTFSTALQKQWSIESAGGIYFTIKSKYSNLYIGVDSSDTSLVKQYSTVNDYTKWYFTERACDRYTLHCKALNITKVLAAPSDTSTSGANLTMVTYSNDVSYRDEWICAIYKDLSMMAVKIEYDNSSFFPDVVQDMNSIGYDEIYHNYFTVNNGMFEYELLERMRYSKIALVNSHGLPYAIQTTGGMLEKSELNAIADSCPLYLSDLIIYGACLTAAGGEDELNLVAATVNAGARTVIGFQDRVDVTACNMWCVMFFEYYKQYYNSEKTLEDICFMASEYVRMNKNDKYEYYDTDGTLVSIAHFVIAGEKTFP